MTDEPLQPLEVERMHVETPESVAFAYELAGLGSRGLALALDMLAIFGLMLAEAGVAAAAAWAVTLALVGLNDAQVLQTWVWAGGITVAVWFATYWGYFIYGEVLRNGRTWGKRRLGIRVVRDDGSRVGALESVIRNLLRLVDILPGNYAIGMASVLLTKSNKRLGDLAAGTVVVRDEGDGTPSLDAVIEDPGVVLGRDFLDRRGELSEPARMQVGSAVLRALGEEPDPGWSEGRVAGRIAELSGWHAHGASQAPDRAERPGPDAATALDVGEDHA